MSDNLEALLPGGTIVAAAVGLLGWFVRNSRDDRTEWKAQLAAQREQAAKELENERARHEREIASLERTESDLRRRLDDDETVIAGLKDQNGDLRRENTGLKARLTGASP